MLVSDFKAKQGHRYPDAFLSSLPDKCLDWRCKSPMEMTEALTSLHCSNPRCPTKISRRLIAITNMLGVKDLGSARANEFVTKWGITNPLSIFAYEPDVDGTLTDTMSMDVSRKIFNQFNTKRSFTLWEYVRLANIPSVQSSALQLFGDFDDLATAYAQIEQGGVDYVRDRLSIKKSEDMGAVSVRALKIYRSLLYYKSDLFDILPYVNIIPLHTGEMRVLRAVCSTEVGYPYRSKADFYSDVNSKFQHVHVDFLNSVTKQTDYLIWAGADGSAARVTNKVQKARKYNDSFAEHQAQGSLSQGEHEIQIVTASQFIQILESLK